jgi:hypothetical protein
LIGSVEEKKERRKTKNLFFFFFSAVADAAVAAIFSMKFTHHMLRFPDRARVHSLYFKKGKKNSAPAHVS